MPEPMSGTSNTGYKIRVEDINDEESVDCSEPFTLLPSELTPIAGEADGPVLVVTSPMDDDMAEACMEYTVEVSLSTRPVVVASQVLRFLYDSNFPSFFVSLFSPGVMYSI